LCDEQIRIGVKDRSCWLYCQAEATPLHVTMAATPVAVGGGYVTHLIGLLAELHNATKSTGFKVNNLRKAWLSITN
jgi:hypothetical protein